MNPPPSSMLPITLSWGSVLIANPRQTIGRSLSTFGLYDLALSELILRLVRPGDLVMDVGANVGYTTRLILDCLQNEGKLLTFEPLPELFEILKKNIGNESAAEAFQIALSDKSGTAEITLPEDFNGNDGVATLESGIQGRKISVRTQTIDEMKISRKVRLMKMDVEGHELSVLKGAENSLNADLFEYIIFEDLAGAHGPTSKFLEEKGYKIFKLVKSFNGLSLRDPDYQHETYDPDNFLATKNAEIVELINRNHEWKLFNWKPRRS